jgi:hypothetical protein
MTIAARAITPMVITAAVPGDIVSCVDAAEEDDDCVFGSLSPIDAFKFSMALFVMSVSAINFITVLQQKYYYFQITRT